jgi:5-methylcytosine-specific restriction protein A
MTGRSVEEWIGKTPETPAPPRVKLRVFMAHGGRCYLSGRPIRPGDKWEVEHVLALTLGGENRETNLAPALVEPHKAKTAIDKKLKSQAERRAKKHLGIHRPKGKIQSRGFDKTRTRKFSGEVVPR